MIYEEQEEVIVRTNADGSQSFIPKSEGNSDYVTYLRYTAWVEAGNNPEEFETVELTQEK